MSEGYASRLKEYPNKGVCGLPEITETTRTWNLKVKRLVEWMKASKHTTVLTGAGISTSCGIPDFRGPNGIWTLEKEESSKQQPKSRKRPREPIVMDFAAAKPSLTHRAVKKLVDLDLVQFCTTQNVDGLHRRSGLSRSKHAVLHGCVFTEVCEDCQVEHFRDTDVGGMSFQKTGRKCELCGGDLRDTLLDWEDELPEDDYLRSIEECKRADLVICLGTSLRIEPAGSLPSFGKRFVIVNLQQTPKDEDASLIIRARVDEVMQAAMEELGYPDWDKKSDPPEIERLFHKRKLPNENIDGVSYS